MSEATFIDNTTSQRNLGIYTVMTHSISNSNAVLNIPVMPYSTEAYSYSIVNQLLYSSIGVHEMHGQMHPN